jgi:hypothetical protein
VTVSRERAPLLDVGPDLFGRGPGELVVKKARGLATEIHKTLLLAVRGAVALVLGNLQPRALGEKPHRVGIAEIFDLHDEVDHTAALVAAEAVVDLLVRRDGEGGVFSLWNGQRPKRFAPFCVS